jgi:hypothetical protein
MKKFFIFCFALVVSGTALYSQNYDDAGLWTTINLEKKLKNNFSIFLTEEFRLKENFSMINLFYTDVGVSFRPASILKIALAYRFTQKYQLDDSYSLRHRAMLDITLRKKFANTTLSYRHRLQTELIDVQSSERGPVPEWYSRSKVEAKYDFGKKYRPFASLELRYQFFNPRDVESDQTWHRYRAALGMEYELNKKNTMGLYYLIQHEWNVSLPDNLYIIGLEYSYLL